MHTLAQQSVPGINEPGPRVVKGRMNITGPIQYRRVLRSTSPEYDAATIGRPETPEETVRRLSRVIREDAK